MKFATFAIACLVLASPALAGRALTQSPGTSCNSFVSVKLQIKHGRCNGSAFTSCRTVSQFEEVVKKSFEGILTPNQCETIDVTASATAIARALATAYTNAFSQMTCSANAQGFGCAFGVSGGDSFSRAYAEAFAQALAFVIPVDAPNVKAICIAEVEALASGFATASSASLSRSCSTNAGDASTYVEEFASAAIKLITKAIATARARACTKQDVSESLCKATVEGSSKDVTVTSTNPFEIGGASGGGTTSGASVGSATALKSKACDANDALTCCFDLRFNPTKSQFSCAPFAVTKDNFVRNILRKKFGGVKECFCH